MYAIVGMRRITHLEACQIVRLLKRGNLLRRSEQQFQVHADSSTPILYEVQAFIGIDGIVPGGVGLHDDAPVAALPGDVHQIGPTHSEMGQMTLPCQESFMYSASRVILYCFYPVIIQRE